MANVSVNSILSVNPHCLCVIAGRAETVCLRAAAAAGILSLRLEFRTHTSLFQLYDQVGLIINNVHGNADVICVFPCFTHRPVPSCVFVLSLITAGFFFFFKSIYSGFWKLFQPMQ